MSDKFKNYFLQSLVTEAEEELTDDVPSAETKDTSTVQNNEDEAWKSTLDKETNPEEFKVQDNPDIAYTEKNLSKAVEWVNEIEGFSEWINGLSSGSLNAQINELDRDGSVFKGIVRSQQRRIVGIAEDLAALSEVFKGYIIGAKKRQREINKMM